MRRLLFPLLFLVALCVPALAQQPDTRPHPSNLRFNKLRIGSLVNCGTNTFVTGFDPRTSAPVCVALSLSMLTDASNVVTTTGVQKVSGKQNVPRVVPLTIVGTTPATVTLNCDTTDIGTLDAIASDITIGVPTCSGTNPEGEQEIEYRFRSSTPRIITWNAVFCEENNVPLLAQTTGDGVKFNRIKFRRNSLSACWGVVANPSALARGITTVPSSATYACDPRIAESCEMQNTLTAGTGVTLAIAAGTYANGTKVLFRIRCTGTQALTLPTGTFLGSATVPLTGMTCTSNSYWTQLGFIFSGIDNRWQIHAFAN
jgi:hypothetical protein